LEDLAEWDSARMALKQAVEISGKRDGDALFRYGLALQRTGDQSTAAEMYQKAMRVSRDRLPASHNNLGIILAGWNRLDDAEAEFNRALEISKGSFPEARHNIGLCQTLRSTRKIEILAELELSDRTEQNE
jgi:Flp pilus assembly protein TadD